MSTQNTAQSAERKITIKLSAKDFVTSIMCFVFSRATLLTYMNPFGMAMYTAGFSPTGWYYALVAAISGIILAKGDATSVRYILALGLSTPVIGLFEKGGIVFRGLCISLCYIGVSAFLMATDGFLMYDMIFIAFESFICFVSVLVLGGSTHLIMNGKKTEVLTPGQAVTVVACVCLFVLSFAGLPEVFGLKLYTMISIFIILCVALEGPVKAGCAGIILGTVISFAETEDVSVIGAYALCSFAAGLLNRYSRLGVLLGFTLANGVITAFLQNSAEILVDPIEVLISGVVFATIPAKSMSVIKNFIKKLSARPKSSKADYVSKLKVLSQELGNLSQIYQNSCTQKKLGKYYINSLFNICVERACASCRLKYNCWQSATYRNYEYMSQMLKYAETKGRLEIKGLPAEFSDQCINKEKFVMVFNYMYDVYRTDKMWLDKLYRVRLAMASQMKCISTVLENPHITKKAMYKVETAVIQRPKDGETVCGDSVCELNLPWGDYAVILSDGMGSGQGAHKQSSDTINMLKSMFMCGFDVTEAVNIVNSSLVIRGNKESFSTVDILYVDCENGTATLVKAGSAPTYMLCNGKVIKYECNNLPVGILNDINLKIHTADIGEQAVFAVISDGISNTVLNEKNEGRIEECMHNAMAGDVKNLAQNIINEAIEVNGGKISDDMTVHTVAIRHTENNIKVGNE